VSAGEWGRSLTQIEFEADGKMTLRAVFVDQSPPGELAHEGHYRVLGNMLTSDAMNKGEPMRFWFDHGELVLQTGNEEPGRLHRVP
jgi:hypothetical protein